jgi:hypothetical protein
MINAIRSSDPKISEPLFWNHKDLSVMRSYGNFDSACEWLQSNLQCRENHVNISQRIAELFQLHEFWPFINYHLWHNSNVLKSYLLLYNDHLCGLVVRVPGYSPRSPGFHSQRYQIFWDAVVLERGPLNLVRITENLFGGEVAVPFYKTEMKDHEYPSRWPRDTTLF